MLAARALALALTFTVSTLACAGAVLSGCASPPGQPTRDAEPSDDSDSAPRAPHCNPLGSDSKYCMLPWPSSFYLAKDPSTPTGFRLAYSAAALPASAKGDLLDPTRYNLLDGFSPSSQPMAYFEGGVAPDGLPGIDDDYASAADAKSLVQIIDFKTGERVPLFAEVEHNALRPGFDTKYKSGLLIRPMQRLHENRRYVVVLRMGVKDQSGKALAPPSVFRKIRDGALLDDDPTVVVEAARLAEVLAFVESHGVARDEMLLVWDFHTASSAATIGNALSMVDDALARIAQTNGPAYAITRSEDKREPELYREIAGEITVPSYLESDDADAWLALDGRGKPVFRGMQQFSFRLHIPACAETATAPLPVMVFGHGLFSSPEAEMSSSYQRTLIERLCMVQIGVKWIGLSSDDVTAVAAQVVPDFSNLPRVTDRLQQAQVNIAALVELVAAGKLLADPLLRVNGKPVSDGKQLYYYGISNGGIQGVAFAALNKRIERFVLQVGGGPWTLMIQRSANFRAFGGLIALRYPDPMNAALLVHLSQSLWDYSDAATWAPHVIADPLPGRAAKKVIYQEARFDSQVPNIATRVLMRTMGLTLLLPRHDKVFGLLERSGPLDSAYVQWDTENTWRPLAGNVTPPAPDKDDSAHEALRRTEACSRQLAAFFEPDGKVVHTCDGPCKANNPLAK